MRENPTITEDKGHFKVFFPQGFYDFDDQYDVIWDMANKAAPTKRGWFDRDEQFVWLGDSKLGRSMSEAISEIIREKLTEHMGIALRQGFLDGMMSTHVAIFVSTINDEKSTVTMQSEIEAIDAERDIAHLDLWIDGELDYTIYQPKLVEETDTHVTLRFKKDQ